MKQNQSQRNDAGITLVALIITIIILVILAAVSIAAVYNSRVVNYAINGATGYASESIRENEIMSGTESLVESTLKRIEDLLGGKTPEEPEPPVDNRPLVTTLTDIQESEVKARDRLGNAITMPKGFKYKEGEIAEKGIVIEDGDGNQFVWIPVSNINHDGTNKIKRENGTEVEITLGRYLFDDTTGAVKTGAGEYQYAINYEDETAFINMKYLNREEKFEAKELKIYKESNRKGDITGTNTTAKDLAGFINSANSNHGYYIARYEASFGSGTSTTDWKPLSKVSIDKSITSMNYTKGTLWNFVTQPDAAKICQNMYSENVNSDLMNSYAWDTAIIFIQQMEDTDYSIRPGGVEELKNTGETSDKACNIFDMAGNQREWSTEFSTGIIDNKAYSCIFRGGFYHDTIDYTSIRFSYSATHKINGIGFRPIIYI